MSPPSSIFAYCSSLSRGVLLGILSLASAEAKDLNRAAPAPSADLERRAAAEVAKRNSQTQDASKLIQEGDALMVNKDYAAALEKFRQAVALIPEAPVVAKHREMAMRRFADASVAQARALGHLGRFEEANTLLDAVLDPTMLPDHDGAATLKQQLRDPDRFNPAMTPDFPEKVTKVRKLLELSGGLVDLGQFDAAMAGYNQVLAIDAHNVAARRGLEKCEKLITDYQHAARDHTRAHALRTVDQMWETAVPETSFAPKLPGENLGGLVATASSKLRGIVFKRINFDQASLAEVVQFYAAKSRELDTTETDPSRQGLNMLVKVPAAEQNKLSKISLDLADVPLYQALDYAAEQTGTKWKLADGIVTFTTIAAANAKLVTRSYSVPPGFLSSAPSEAAPAAANADPFSTTGNPAASTGLTVTKVTAQSYLEANGVPFPAGASARFDRGNSRLTVTNTEENLDAIQGIVDQMSSKATKQASVRVTLLKISQKDLKELGFDILLGQFNIGKRLFGGGGTYSNQGTPSYPAQDYPGIDPSFGGAAIPTGQLPLTGGLRSSGSIDALPTIDSLLQTNRYTKLTSTRSPSIFGLIGQFTDPQFQLVTRALNQKTGKDLLNASEVLVKSGQIASARSVRELPFPTDFDPPQIPQSTNANGIGGIGVGGIGGLSLGGNNFPITPTTPTTFKVEEVGNIIEVEATIAEDGSSVDVRLAPSFTEFLGFINYGSSINTVEGGSLVELSSNLIVQPVFDRIRTGPQSTITVYDGNTLMLGGLLQSKVNEIEDKTPFLGDVPLLGRLFRTKITESTRTAIIIFVTVNVVDPAGRSFKTAKAP